MGDGVPTSKGEIGTNISRNKGAYGRAQPASWGHVIYGIQQSMAREDVRDGLEATVDKEKKYREEIEKSMVPLYGTLKPGIKALNSLRFMLMNVNCLATWKSYNYKIERLRWALTTYRGWVCRK